MNVTLLIRIILALENDPQLPEQSKADSLAYLGTLAKVELARLCTKPRNLGVVPLILVQLCHRNSQLSGTTV